MLLGFNPLCVQLDMVCIIPCIAKRTESFNPLCVQLDMVKGHVAAGINVKKFQSAMRAIRYGAGDAFFDITKRNKVSIRYACN